MAFAHPMNGVHGLPLNRSSKRLTITVPFSTFSALESRSLEEGRSLSNLAAYLIERGLEEGSGKG